MREISLGIVGLGRFAQLHLQCLQQLPGVRIAAVCDVNSALAARIGEELGCPAYTDPLAMIASQRLDALDILTPEFSHYEPVMAGLAAGCHIFVEKPLDIDSARAKDMIAQAAAMGLLLMVGQVARFDVRFIQVRQAIAEGRIGKPRCLHFRRSDRREYFHLYKRSHPIFILGIHDIDQLVWNFNALPVEIYAKSSASAIGEDAVSAMLTYADGMTAIIESNWLTADGWPANQQQSCHVWGEQGSLQLQFPDAAIGITTDAKHYYESAYMLNNVHDRLEGPLYAELAHFAECVRSGCTDSPIIPARDSLMVVQIAEAIVESCRTGKAVAWHEMQGAYDAHGSHSVHGSHDAHGSHNAHGSHDTQGSHDKHGSPDAPDAPDAHDAHDAHGAYGAPGR